MQRQLRLIHDELLGGAESDWRLDDHTKEMGRQGIAEARQALAEARRRTAA